MQAVLLAAGKSSRFYPYNQTFEHKSLVPLMGKTILEHTIDALRANDITDIILVVGENSGIPEMFGNGERLGVSLTYRKHVGAQGMGAALLDAKDVIRGEFFLLNANHIDFGTFAKDMYAKYQEGKAVLLGCEERNSSAFGYMTIDGDKVTDIVEKPHVITTDMLRVIGMYLLPQTFLQTLEKTPLSHYHFEEALQTFAKTEEVLFVRTENHPLSLKYVTDLFAMKDYLLGGIAEQSISKEAHIAESAEIIGNVVIEEGAKILEGVCIKGPAYIGRNVTVGNRAILRNGVMVEEGAVIGSQLEVKNTLIMPRTTTHSGFIGDSLIGQDTKIAANVVTANARLDRQPVAITVKEERILTGLRHVGAIIGSNANLGIRVSTMPGIIIGNNVVIGPSTTVMKDVADKRKYYTKFQEVVEEIYEK